MKGKGIATAFLALGLVLLSGCFVKTVDEMYALPQHSDEYYNLQQAIDAVMAGGASYCAPVSGVNQQSVQLADLDGDGIQELAIGARKDDPFFGKLVFSLYILDENGAPQLLLDSSERNRYYYAGGFCFANQGSSGWNDSFDTTLKLEDGELIDMTYTTEPENYVQMELMPFAQWK